MRLFATILLGFVWMANGLGAKVLGLVPRHRLIVARFFGEVNSVIVTRAIGAAEIAMSVWILSGRRPALCALTQAVVIIAMNSLELWRARDLLLFPRLMPIANGGLLCAAFWLSRPG